MSVYSNDAFFQFVGTATRSTNTTIPTLPNGAVGIFDESGTAVTGALSATSGLVKVVKRKNDGSLLQSPWFSYASIVGKKQQAYSGPVEQVTYVGTTAAANTTVAGLGTITTSNTYSIDVPILSAIGDLGGSPLIKTSSYQAVSGETQATLAKGLLEVLRKEVSSSYPFPYINVERIADGTGGTSVAAFTTATMALMTKNSRTVNLYTKSATADTVVTASTSGGALTTPIISIPTCNGRTFTFTANAAGSSAGGHAIYIGSSSYYVADAGLDSDNATAIAVAINAGTVATASVATNVVTITYRAGTSNLLPPVVLYDTTNTGTYTAISVTTTVGENKAVKYVANTVASGDAILTLDEPWLGETGYVYSGTTEATNIGVTTLTTTAEWGLKFTGIPMSFNAITGRYNKIRFTVTPLSSVNTAINPYTGSAYSYALGFDATVVAIDVQGVFDGTGIPSQVAEEEILSQFQNRNYTLQAYPPTVYTQETNMSAPGYTITSLDMLKQLNDTPGEYLPTHLMISIAIDASLTTNDNTVLSTVFTV